MSFSNKERILLFVSIGASLILVSLAVLCGSVYIEPKDAIQTILGRISGAMESGGNTYTIIFQLRIPRVILAFLTGAATAAAGAATQTCLHNHLASPFTLGASAGGALGAGIVIISGLSIPLIGNFTLPLVAIVFSLAAIMIVSGISTVIDKSLSSNTVVLCGMVLSLFFNAVLVAFGAVNRENMQRIALWQLGSFALKGYEYVLLILPFAVIGISLLFRYSTELDILSFGDEHALSLGISLSQTRGILLTLCAVLTGASVAASGIIGFVDLVAPHMVRRIFGSRHSRIIPLSALFGGAVMVCADLLARVVISPSEMPVGAITALIGAPFFVFVFFSGRKKNDKI